MAGMTAQEHEEEFVNGADYRLLQEAIVALREVVEDLACDGNVSDATFDLICAVLDKNA